ncbi:hypothetical protein [Salinimicrobium terrae]|uniref:hypothetical protein n=1 Tax=Salinimicrobium terrae TaxID=470866 RepID=UPI000410D256|nr:hypothetical protein [Salinimicrobium terrae]
MTTKNKGGRNFYLNEDNSIYVKSNHNEVNSGVEHFKQLKIDPKTIRDSTLSQIYKERLRFAEFLKYLMTGKDKLSKEQIVQNLYDHPDGIKHFKYKVNEDSTAN